MKNWILLFALWGQSEIAASPEPPPVYDCPEPSADPAPPLHDPCAPVPFRPVSDPMPERVEMARRAALILILALLFLLVVRII